MPDKTERKKAIVIIANTLTTFGGGERWVLEVTTRLRNKFSITIINPFSKNDVVRMSRNEIARRYELGGIRILDVECSTFKMTFNRSSKFLAMVPKLSEIGKMEKAIRSSDLVYAVSLNPVLLMYASLFSRMYGKRFIMGLHNPEFLKEEIDREGLSRLVQKIVLKNVKEIHGQTETQIRMLAAEKYKGKIYYIPHFLYLSPDAYVNIKKDSGFLVLFVGRLDGLQKGVDMLQEIIKSTISKEPGIRFRLIGSGEEGGRILEKLTREYPENVEWYKFISDKDLIKQYRVASLFILPSRYETPGLSLLEAQSYGLPAVAFNVQGPRDIIKSKFQGKLIEPFDVGKFSDEIISYYRLYRNNKSKYEAIGPRISKEIGRRYSEKSFIKKFVKMLSQTAG